VKITGLPYIVLFVECGLNSRVENQRKLKFGSRVTDSVRNSRCHCEVKMSQNSDSNNILTNRVAYCVGYCGCMFPFNIISLTEWDLSVY